MARRREEGQTATVTGRLENALKILCERPWDMVVLRYDAGEWRCTLHEGGVREVEGDLRPTAVGAVKSAALRAAFDVAANARNPGEQTSVCETSTPSSKRPGNGDAVNAPKRLKTKGAKKFEQKGPALLLKVYEPTPDRGRALASWLGTGGARHYKWIPLRRPRLLFSGFVKRSTPLREYLWLPKVGTRRIRAVGCEGRALAVHVA